MSHFHICSWAGDVWIIGDSIVRQAESSLQCTPQVCWNCKDRALLLDINSLLSSLAVSGPPPALIIIHVGANDLVPLDVFGIRQSIRIFMEDCRSRVPGGSDCVV